MSTVSIASILKKIWFQLSILLFMLCGHIFFEIFPEVKEMKGYALYQKWAHFFNILFVTWAIARIITVFRDSAPITRSLTPRVRSVVFLIARTLVFALGLMVALDSLGVSITPILASLGVGSIAVGLALQDTLGNLFSGMFLYLDRPIAEGDWVRLETGLEGQVRKIGWRSTRILSGGNIVTTPNSKLSSAGLVNFNQPSPTTSFPVVFGVSYESDLDALEVLIREAVLEGIAANPALSAEEPTVRYSKFSDSFIEVSVGLVARSFPDQAELRHQVIKAIRRRFSAKKVALAYPQQIVRELTLDA